MFERLYPWAVAAVLIWTPLAATPQQDYLLSVTLPAAPPDLSPDCRTSHGVQERVQKPFIALRRAVRSKSSIKVLGDRLVLDRRRRRFLAVGDVRLPPRNVA